MPREPLSFDVLIEGLPGVTASKGLAMSEAASVCLCECAHELVVQLNLDGDYSRVIALQRLEVTEQMTRTWADPDEATEEGACAIAISIVHHVSDFTVVERSRKGTGFDYWLGPKANPDPLFQEKSRLEVSGIRKGNQKEIARRMEQKIEQVTPTDGQLGAYVSVVEFSEPRARVRNK